MKIYDFKNPEDFKTLEKQAYDMSIDIEKFPPAAYRYFDKLRNIYARYKYDNLSKEDAEAEKRKIYSDYIKALNSYDMWCAMYAQYQEDIRQCGQILNDIEKSHDVTEIALLACTAISLMTSDRNFIKRQERKLNHEKYE